MAGTHAVTEPLMLWDTVLARQAGVRRVVVQSRAAPGSRTVPAGRRQSAACTAAGLAPEGTQPGAGGGPVCWAAEETAGNQGNRELRGRRAMENINHWPLKSDLF